MDDVRSGNLLAKHLRELIAGSGFSQHQIAKEAGIKQPTLSKFLNGGSMKIETMAAVLDVLKLSLRPNDEVSQPRQERSLGSAATKPCELSGLNGRYSTILVDPPWRFQNRTGKMAPEHRRLKRYATMTTDEICQLPVAKYANKPSHLYLWCPNALLRDGLAVMEAWGFTYKTNVVWYKVRKDGGPDGRGVGFYFRNVTELLLFGVRGSMRTLAAGRRQVNILATRKREHSRKPVEIYDIIEQCSPGPYLELFARDRLDGWTCWGDQVDTYEQTRPLYKAYNGKRVSTDEQRRLSCAVIATRNG